MFLSLIMELLVALSSSEELFVFVFDLLVELEVVFEVDFFLLLVSLFPIALDEAR